MTITIKGLAYRAGSDPAEHPAEWHVPAELPLSMSFDDRQRIGTATLTHLHVGSIQASCELLPPRGWSMEQLVEVLGNLPYFAVGVALPMAAQLGGGEPDGRVISLSVVDRNVDSELPRWGWVR